MQRVLFVVAMALPLSAQMTEISGDRIRAHVKFLSSDLLEGRGVGARGGDLASDYIATQFALVGAMHAIFHRSLGVSCCDQSILPESRSNAMTASE